MLTKTLIIRESTLLINFRRPVVVLAYALALCSLSFMAKQAHSESQPESSAIPEGYKLVWSDEFQGTELDTNKWAFRVDNKHRSLQREENVSIREGALHLDLKTFDKPVQGKKASGAGIVSKKRFRYGYYEVRARLGVRDQQERGWHHSFWAMAAVVDEAGYVATSYPEIRRTEIDCYENPTEHIHEPIHDGLSNFSQHVIVWNEKGKEAGRLPKPPSDITKMTSFDATDWHTYAFRWTPESVTFYVDGQVTKVADYPSSEYQHDQVNLWLTAISANWNRGKQIPSQAEYDYIRAYEPKE